MRRGTALEIIQQAATELGLPKAAQAVSSLDLTNVQMTALLNGSGADLMDMYDWQFALKTHNIITTANEAFYARPADFLRQINQSIWDKTNRRPAMGPVSPQGWSWITNSAISVGPFVRYRAVEDKIEFNPAPSSGGQQLNYQYVSQNWVISSLDNTVRLDRVGLDDDIVMFDFWLMVKYLKVKMWAAKGLDIEKLAGEFSAKFNSLTGSDKGAPVLSLAPCREQPFISGNNVPDGNWMLT